MQMTKKRDTITVAEIPDVVEDYLIPPMFEMPQSAHVLNLTQRFLIPPFTQLDARSGEWQRRKQMWATLGLSSEKGRTAKTFAKHEGGDPVSQKILALTDGQSIFDPVLCEMMYLWFCPVGGTVLDPFAGGSVRGIVAGFLGYRYVGVDLSQDQIFANFDQDAEFRERDLYVEGVAPTWYQGDSIDLDAVLEGTPDDIEYDFIWSCPPYHDLEQYSKDPRDLSNMDWNGFIKAYRHIIDTSVARLKDDRFCAFVVGEIRGPDGKYRHFVQETIDAFEMAGACYYNEALLVSPAGTLPLRAAKQFVVSRKMGRTHQTLLVFVKGDPKAAASHCKNEAAMAAALQAAGLDIADVHDAPDEDLSGMGHG
jgi:hypothetical protein